VTPQEFDLVRELLEGAAKAAYMQGREDCEAGKPADIQQLALGPGEMLLIKKEINKRTKKR